MKENPKAIMKKFLPVPKALNQKTKELDYWYEKDLLALHEKFPDAVLDLEKEQVYFVVDKQLRVAYSSEQFKIFPNGAKYLTKEERSLGGSISTKKKTLASYLHGLHMREDLSPRQQEYVRHVKNNDMVGLVKQLTADLLASSNDPIWLHKVYKDIIKLMPKKTLVEMQVTKTEKHEFDIDSLGLNPDQQKRLGDFMANLLAEESNLPPQNPLFTDAPKGKTIEVAPK